MTVSGLPDDLDTLAREIHADNIAAGWWKRDAGMTLPRNIGELLCLVHSEISEADEGVTCDIMDDKLPLRPMVEVELGDTAIRVLDMLGYYQTDIRQTMRDGGPLPLPGSDWAAWLLLTHRTTSVAMERFRKQDIAGGCAALVRLLGVLHFCATYFGLDLTGAIADKREFNRHRADHKLENRAAAGGKQF